MTMFAQFATAFGIGRTGKAPGTLASFVAVVIAAPLMMLWGWIGVAILAVLTTALGIVASDAYSVQTDIDDPKDCVIDEFAGQWIACALMGLAGPADGVFSTIVRLVFAFAMFRLFDIAKPGLVGRAERLRGGIGIMADDVVAGLIAGFVVFLFADAGLV